MEINKETKLPISTIVMVIGLLGGVIFTAGTVINKVDSIESYNDDYLMRLADDNMNKIIALEIKMNLLVTPQMTIVPSNKHASHELARAKLDARIKSMEAWITHEEKKKEERRLEDLYDDRQEDNYRD
jgi:hypothetical protein